VQALEATPFKIGANKALVVLPPKALAVGTTKARRKADRRRFMIKEKRGYVLLFYGRHRIVCSNNDADGNSAKHRSCEKNPPISALVKKDFRHLRSSCQIILQRIENNSSTIAWVVGRMLYDKLCTSVPFHTTTTPMEYGVQYAAVIVYVLSLVYSYQHSGVDTKNSIQQLAKLLFIYAWRWR
jgi:hypothetical protein